MCFERQRAALEEVLEAAGRRDDDVRLGGLAGLGLDADAAVDGRDGERAGMRDLVQLVDDLDGELARRGQHEAGGPARVGGDALDQRDAEGERLARTGRRLGEHVATGEDVLDDEALDRERLGDAALRERGQHGTGYAEIGEGLLRHWTATP